MKDGGYSPCPKLGTLRGACTRMFSPLKAGFSRLDSVYRDQAHFAGIKARLLFVFILILFVFLPINVGKVLWVQPPEIFWRLLMNGVFALAGGAALWMIFKGRIDLAGGVLVLVVLIPAHTIVFLKDVYWEPVALGIQIFVADLVLILLALVFASRWMAVGVLGFIVACHLVFYQRVLSGEVLLGSLQFAAETLMRDGLITFGFVFGLGITLVVMIEAAHRRTDQSLRETRILNDNLEKLVSERTRDLEAATLRAHEASQAKGEFLANVSHEIRTPLHGIIASSELLLDSRDLSPAAAAHCRLIAESGGLLLKVLGDVLDFSKIESGQLELEARVFELASLVSDTVALVAVRAGQENVQLFTVVAPGLPRFVEGDSFRLRQVLLNLLSNAVKFTPAGGHVRLAVREGAAGAGRVGFEVRDTGIGMDEEARNKVFTRFTQAAPSTTRRYGGTGLGLAISGRLVEMMGGCLEVESAPGEGSAFSFEIPLPAASTPDECPGPLKSAPGSLGLYVLVAEDNSINQKILGAQLERLGCRFTMARDGAEALAVLERGPLPDVILMDCDMPNLDGWETTRCLRRWKDGVGVSDQQRAAALLPVIALTAATLPEERSRCFEAGMNDFFSKPLKMEGLLRVLIPHARTAAAAPGDGSGRRD